MPAVDVARLAPPNSKPIYRLVRRTRSLLRVTWIVTGLALTVGLLLGALGLVLAGDLLLPLLQLPFYIAYPVDSGLRLAALVLVAVPPVAAFLAGVVFPLFRRLTAGNVARRIESHIPGIHNRLVSCIDLESRGRAAASPVFYRRLLTESLDRIRGFRPGRVLDFVNLRRAVLVAVVGAIAFGLVCVLFWGRLPTAFARIFRPFEDIPPASSVAYEVQPGPGVHHFLRDDKIDFAADVKGGEIPALWLRLQADNGAVRDFDLTAASDDPMSFKLTLDSASIGPAFLNGFHYRVYGGGTWSPRYALPLSERPLVKAVDTAVFYPAYMGIPEAHPTPAEASEIIGPEGGEIEVAVQAEGNVAVGELQPLKAGTVKIPPRDQVERLWFEDAVPDGASDGGTWQQVKKDKHAAHTEPYAMGPHGHWFQEDKTGFIVQPGEVLFAYVNIDPQAPPDEIFLQWNDGKTWDHGAYWGVDLIREGKAGAVSRHPVDKVPHAGGWVRLEVPAAKVGLEGQTLHGMAFKLSGGQCWWGKSGAVRLDKPTFVPDETLHPFPMKSDGSGRWVGRVPLLGKGQFRPELRNEQGDANTDVQELHYSAIKDQPPNVVLQQPGAELPLSKPQATPLTILAFDDYGLADVSVFFRDDEKQPFQSRILRHFDQPERSQTVVASLLETEALKPGAPLHYYVQVSDRKGQTARTPDAVVYLKDDANAADKQEEAFDKTQDTFRDRLLQMIAEQKKVQTTVEKLTTQYAEMTDKVRKDQEAATPPPPAATDPTKPPPPIEKPKLDPETAKKLSELEKELAKLAQDQDKNAQAASQLNNDLAKANEQAEKLQTLPQPVVDQMQALQQAFEQTAVKAMQDLTKDFNQGANPQAEAPDLKDIEQKSDRLAKDLESIKDRMQALEDARKGLRDDLAKAIQELQRQMLNQDGKLSESDLQELRDFIAKMREQLKDLQNQQENLLNNAENNGDLKDLDAKQADLDKQLEKMLDAARKMLDAKRNPNRRKPEFPDAPYTPDDEVKVPPKEDDTNEPLPNAKKPGDKTKPGDKKPDDMKDDDDKEPLDMPALGGPKQVPDKRFDKKKRPSEKKLGEKDDPDAPREDLESHQNDQLRDLDAAQKSLASDQQSLEKMMQALEQAMKNNGGQKPQQQNPGDPSDDAMQQLAQMLQSPAMRQMRDMLNRMRQGQASKGQPHPPSNQPPPPSRSQSSMAGNNPPVMSAELAKLPPDMREAFLKLPPRLQEELLQSRQEKDAEGFGPFIEDYFKRLTQTKNP